MKWLLVLSVVWLNACTMVYVQPGPRPVQTYDILQQKVFVRVINNVTVCAPVLDLETDKGLVKYDLEEGGSFTVLLTRDHDIGPPTATLNLTVKAKKGGKVIGSINKPYDVNSYTTGRHDVWEVNYVNMTSEGWKICQK